MTRMRFTIVLCILMALAVNRPDWLAVTMDTPAYTHFVYMFGHAGWLHYAVNAWTLLVLHNLFRWYRVLASYACAVLISYLPLTDRPMLGASVIVCFFVGVVIRHLWHRQRLSAVLTMALIALTCVIPGFAGSAHLMAFLSGAVFLNAEAWIRDMGEYIKE